MDRNELYCFLKSNTALEKFIYKISKKPNYKYLLNKYVYTKKYERFHFSLETGRFNYFEPAFKDFIITKSPRYTDVHSHSHDYIELIYVYRGKLTQIIEDRQLVLEADDICILDTHCRHSLDYLTEDDIVVNFMLSKTFFNSIFINLLNENELISDLVIDSFYKDKTKRYIIFKGMANSEIGDIMEKILCEYFNKKHGSKTIINGYLLVLFTLLLRGKEDEKSEEIPSKSKFIEELNNYLKDKYQTATLDDLAKHFNYSRAYMSNLIKQRTGKSFVEFLQEFKLKEACFLLKNTDLSAMEIISKIGYSNVSYFYRIFKNEYDMSPVEFRKKA